jgi:hypothetical protein
MVDDQLGPLDQHRKNRMQHASVRAQKLSESRRRSAMTRPATAAPTAAAISAVRKGFSPT